MKKLICSAALAGAVSFSQAPPTPPEPPQMTIPFFAPQAGGNDW